MYERGKLIVITGPDGCGKATQTKLLRDKLEKTGYKTESIDFPQYNNNFFGEMVGRYLSGEFGHASALNPFLASMLYAGDRFESMEKINNWLKYEKKIVVCDRYTGDNFLHQGSKFSNEVERNNFFNWLEELEYKVYKAVMADMTLYLNVPLEISLKLLEEKSAKERKSYTGGKTDGHENKKHLSRVRKISAGLIKKFGWVKINCDSKRRLLPPDQINEKIWEKVQPILNL